MKRLGTVFAMLLAGCGGAGGSTQETDAADGEARAPSPAESVAAQPAPIPLEEYEARRRQVMSEVPDGILLLHARPSEKAMEQWGFVQDPTFLYYSGLADVPAAILALDGASGESHLFLSPPPESFGMQVEGLVPEPGPATAERYGFDSARPWVEFVPWVSQRLAADAEALYTDGSRRPQATGVPPGMASTAGDLTLWRAALEQAFPQADVRSAVDRIMRQRAVKSDAEIRILERNARMTATSLLAVADRLEPGVRQRETEAAMVVSCIESGGEGPSFWPWTMSGPNAQVPSLVGAFFRYDQGDRVARAGELVRVDIGCAGGHYGADVGRMLPVSGAFEEGQAEAWDLLIEGYRAGLDAMADGVPVSEVRAASAAAVEAAGRQLTSEAGRVARDAISSGGEATWHIHGVGVESGEALPDVLRAGMVVAYEPGFSVGDDAFYLEDMILVTESGHRVLSAGLPYTAAEIEVVMSRDVPGVR